MQQYTNTDVHTRTWNHLVDRATGTTLRLESGESTKGGVGIWVEHPDEGTASTVEELPEDFSDAHLKPVAARQRKPQTDTASTDGATNPAEGTPAADPKE